MEWLSLFRSLGFYVIYPITVIYSLFAALLGFLAGPFLHVLIYVYYICKLPFQLLSKFEPLYTFFGVATVFGLLAGCVLHLSLSFMYNFFGLAQDSKEIETPKRSLVRQSRANSVKKPRVEEDDDDTREPYMEHIIPSSGSRDLGSALTIRRRRRRRLSRSS